MARIEDDPIEFSLAFVAALRKRTDLAQQPSLRTAVAIPRFLSARLFRKGSLTARDFVEAAVYITPHEDQAAAFETARELLFPKEKPREEEPAKEADADVDAVAVSSKSTQTAEPSLSLLDDLAGMNLGDLGSLDLAALDKALDAKTAAAVEMKSLDLMSALAGSKDEEDRGIASLVSLFGGPTELEVEGAHDKAAAKELVIDRLKAKAGALTPDEAFFAGKAGLDDDILDELRLPWERAGVLAAGGAKGIKELLAGALDEGSAHELGKMLAFLAPHEKKLGKSHATFKTKALASAEHLSDWAEMLEGLGAFVPPPKELIASSAAENLPRALAAADALEKVFGNARSRALIDADAEDFDDDDDDHAAGDDADALAKRGASGAARGQSDAFVSMKPTVFEAWADSLGEPPSLDFLVECCVDCERWRVLVKAAFESDVVARLEAAREIPAGDARAEQVWAVLPVGKKLRATGTATGRALGAELATWVLVVIDDRARFLPLLDALVDARLLPSDNARVVAAGTALGIAEEEIWARLSAPLEQLRYLIEAKVVDVERYRDLVGKLDNVPQEMLEELVRICLERLKSKDELERRAALLGLALLLAVELGPATALMPEDVVTTALGYKGVGGGENLLVQWFEHKAALQSGSLRERIKAIAKAALLDAAFAWVHKGTGSADRGLVPQSRARPFRGGDEVDDLDIEATLDAIIGAGKSLEQIGDEDLMVQDTSAGRAGFGVLIDISGSMSGKDLAVCAIGVVMLLGKLKPDEVAIALFESNTHVVKRFHEQSDLDEVADRLLEIQATGGTRVDAALKFMAEEFESEREHERRLLFLLSDFCFFEDRSALAPIAHRFVDLDVGYLGASHGSVCKGHCEMFVSLLGGHSVKLSSLQKLPEILLQALTVVGEGRLK